MNREEEYALYVVQVFQAAIIVMTFHNVQNVLIQVKILL
jgi:hypothetical protein